jgi:hypothetical protein
MELERRVIAMAKAEFKVHADCPDRIVIFVLRSDDGWEFRTEADEATRAKVSYRRMRRHADADRRSSCQAI